MFAGGITKDVAATLVGWDFDLYELFLAVFLAGGDNDVGDAEMGALT